MVTMMKPYPFAKILTAFAVALSACACGGGEGSSDSGDSGPADGGVKEIYDYCSGKAPDSACYAAKRDPSSADVTLAKAIADRYMAIYPADKLKWDWEPTVLMFGLSELYRVTGDVRYRDYYRAWIDRHIDAGYEIVTSDTCAPALLAAILYMDLGVDKYLAVVNEAFDYLDHRALRTKQGGINHMGVSSSLGVTLWLDSLFMFGELLTRWGEFSNDKARLEMYGGQFRIFTDLLQSPGGLFVHAYGWVGQVDKDIYWGRGNGWITASGFDHLRALRLRGESNPQVELALKRQVSAIISSQDAATGMWWTVLNRPGDTYLETSAGALFAYGLARGYRYGYLDKDVLPVISSAIAGVKSKIHYDDQGRPIVGGVSVGTTAGTFSYYAGLAVKDDLGYGVGAVILSLIDSSGLPDK
jgi:unsaturated rhamnogalacturonyl hydrolase